MNLKKQKRKQKHALKMAFRQRKEALDDSLRQISNGEKINPQAFKKTTSEFFQFKQQLEDRAKSRAQRIPPLEHSLEPAALKILNKMDLYPKCPHCGEASQGNTVNGKIWCFHCQMPINSEESRSPIRSLTKSEAFKLSLLAILPKTEENIQGQVIK